MLVHTGRGKYKPKIFDSYEGGSGSAGKKSVKKNRFLEKEKQLGPVKNHPDIVIWIIFQAMVGC